MTFLLTLDKEEKKAITRLPVYRHLAASKQDSTIVDGYATMKKWYAAHIPGVTVEFEVVGKGKPRLSGWTDDLSQWQPSTGHSRRPQ